MTFHFSVSMTTRPRRPTEVDGVDYHFVDTRQFEAAIARGDLAEWAVYSGHHYGTLRSEVDGHLEAGRDVLLDIEILGARQVREAYPDAVMIYILPPSMEELERRLRSRGDTDEDAMSKRLGVAAAQISEARELFDYFVVNDDLLPAIEEVTGILAGLSPPLDPS
jgi:guanylate kinase